MIKATTLKRSHLLELLSLTASCALCMKGYRGFRIDGPASSWPKGHEKAKSSWPGKNCFGHNSPGLSPILMSVCMVKDTIINKLFRAPGPHRADF